MPSIIISEQLAKQFIEVEDDNLTKNPVKRFESMSIEKIVKELAILEKLIENKKRSNN